MYPNLRAEIARTETKLKDLADYLGIEPQTLSLKLSGKIKITFEEAVMIKEFLGVKTPLEILFAKGR